MPPRASTRTAFTAPAAKKAKTAPVKAAPKPTKSATTKAKAPAKPKSPAKPRAKPKSRETIEDSDEDEPEEKVVVKKKAVAAKKVNQNDIECDTEPMEYRTFNLLVKNMAVVIGDERTGVIDGKASAKEMAKGSFGWSMSKKAKFQVGKGYREFSITMNATMTNSAPDKELAAHEKAKSRSLSPTKDADKKTATGSKRKAEEGSETEQDDGEKEDE